MNNVHYFTIADVRAADPEGFDAAIKSAVFAAAEDVGFETVASAFVAAEQVDEPKAELIGKLDMAIALAQDIRKQWEEIGAILEEQHKMPLAA